MYIFVYIYIYICTYIYVYILCMYVCICICVHSCISVIETDYNCSIRLYALCASCMKSCMLVDFGTQILVFCILILFVKLSTDYCLYMFATFPATWTCAPNPEVRNRLLHLPAKVAAMTDVS